VASKSQRKAARTRRRRAEARELVRVEVRALRKDADLIRALTERLHGDADKAAKALIHPKVRTAFDVFGSELSDEVFAGVFDTPRQRGWREVPA
jgi:hypothetical protein